MRQQPAGNLQMYIENTAVSGNEKRLVVGPAEFRAGDRPVPFTCCFMMILPIESPLES